VPAAVALSDDDGAADTATLSQAEPVLTETMAELYLKQGHQQDALRVYQALLTQRPGDARLRRRVEQLSGGSSRKSGGSGVSAQAFLKGIWSGRGAAPAPVPAPPIEQSTLGAAFEAAEPAAPPGEPSRPAQDHISLDAVFGDDSARHQDAPPTRPSNPNPAPAGGGSFSFDEFFQGGAPASPPGAAPGGASVDAPIEEGAPSEPGARTPGRSSGRVSRPPEDEVEADQFQQWLKKLKS
jgi:hypothetical protein